MTKNNAKIDEEAQRAATMGGQKTEDAKARPTAEEFGHLFDDGLGGFDGLNAATIALPFIRVLQDMSPQVKPRNAEYVEGAAAGMFYNNVNNDTYESPLRVVVGRFERYYIEWRPNRGGFVGAHSVELVEKMLADGKLILDDDNKITNDAGNLFQDTYVYFVLMPDFLEDGVCIVSLSSTQLKEARKWNRLLTTTYLPNGQRALPHFMVWEIATIPMSNDKGEWFGIKVKQDGFVDKTTFEAVNTGRKELPPSSNIDLRALEDGSGAADALPAGSRTEENGAAPY